MNTTSILWYNSPAKAWTQSLPIGNGTLGAMVFGSPAHERLALNHDELWTGRPKDTVREGAPEYTGRLCVIGSDLKEDKLKELFKL